MTPQERAERQKFFEQNGYFPMKFVERRVSQRELAERAAQQLQQSLRQAGSQKGWKAPLHWTVPAAFARPGLIYERIGHEAFCEAVEEYYARIREAKVERAGELHTRWAIRQILRTFETHVRGFRGQSVSKAGPYGSGGRVFDIASDVLVLPETLVEDGRLMNDLPYYFHAYGIPQEQWPAVDRLIRAKLTGKWGVKC
jgi:hypothetical protein